MNTVVCVKESVGIWFIYEETVKKTMLYELRPFRVNLRQLYICN